MTRFHLIKFGKLLTGAVVASYLASLIGLTYSYSAGIIALLSIQDTKKETLLTSGKRLLIFVAMTLLSVIIYPLMGYHLPAFAVILIPYLLICLFLNMKEAIAPIAVLCTHYISSQSCSLPMIGNELLILVIGAGTGILLNLFFTENKMLIRREQESIETQMRSVLLTMAKSVTCDSQKPESSALFSKLDSMLSELEHEATLYLNNHFSARNDYFFHYVRLRTIQCSLLKRIYVDISRLKMIPEQAVLISNYFQEIARVFHETNNADLLLAQLDTLYRHFDREALPVTRQEFENRALLFHILEDLKEFVELKQRFYQTHQETIEELAQTAHFRKGA